MKEFMHDLAATARWVMASLMLGVVLYALLGLFAFGVAVTFLAMPIILVFRILAIVRKRHDR